METAARIIKQAILEAGAVKAGISAIRPVSDEEVCRYDLWISKGFHGSMTYLERYPDIRRDPSLLLENACSIISCAFPYYTGSHRKEGNLNIADYALGDDYHTVIRKRLKPVVKLIRERFGARARITTDTAPLRERLWAAQSGVGFIGLNNQLIVPGFGSKVFLGEIITSLPLTPDTPLVESCMACGACLRACPGKALSWNGDHVTLDARKCLSYLTIEYDGDLPRSLDGHFYGCDVCQDVCPHNQNIPVTGIEEFSPRASLLDITAEEIAALDENGYNDLFANSAMRRVPLERMRRNLENL